jgi:HicB family
MQMAPHIEALLSDLAEMASLGDEASAQAAQRLGLALRSSFGLRMLDVLTEAALELSSQLPSGHVEVRLVGQDPNFVYVSEEEPTAAPTSEEAMTARITLRLPEGLKASVEAAAAREGLSTNTWLIKALARAVSVLLTSQSRGPGNRLSGFAKS